MPDKTLTDLPRDLRDLFQRGKEAFQRQNYEYATTFFTQCLTREPGFLEARQALRATQFKKGGANAGFFKKIVGGASAQPLLAKAQLTKGRNPVEAMQIAEQVLDGDPNNASAHKILAECALEADLPKTACFAYEILLKNAPRDYDLTMAYGEALSRAGNIVKAEQVYTELQRSHPHKPEIATAIKNLSARRTLDEGGYEALSTGTGSYRDILKNKEEAVSLEQQNRTIRSEDRNEQLIAEYEAKAAAEPRNLKVLRNIAELYAQKKDYVRAIEYYERIRATEGGADPSLEKAITETQLKRIDHQIGQLDMTQPDQAAQAEALQKEKAVFQLEETRKRAERYPTDLQIRFELAQLYLAAGKYNEAMAEFQKSQANPQRRLQSMTGLAQCMAAKGMNDMAARRLQDALKEKAAFDDEKKEMIYALGVILEKMGKREEAIEQLKQIYEVDISYKDVAAKVDAYYAGGGQ